MYIDNIDFTVHQEDLKLGYDFPLITGKALISGLVFTNVHENLIIDPIKFEVEISDKSGNLLGYLDLLKIVDKESKLMDEIKEVLESDYEEKRSQDYF